MPVVVIGNNYKVMITTKISIITFKYFHFKYKNNELINLHFCNFINDETVIVIIK